MATRNSFLQALALGGAATCGSMGFMALLCGTTARMATESEAWSPQMVADVMRGVSIMFSGGIGLVVLAVVLGVVGWMLSRGQSRSSMSTTGRAGR